MHKNPLWLIFLAGFAAILIWYSGDAAWKLWKFESLTARTTADQASFSVVEGNFDKHHILAKYQFSVGDKKYNGETLLAEPYFRNRWSAEEALTDLKERKWDVWYAPANPEHSTLQKNFPFKECLYATILWALLAYFFWIGYRVAKGFS